MISGTNASDERLWLLPEEGTFSIRARDFHLSGDIGRADYAMANRRVAYMFSEDLGQLRSGVPNGVFSGSFLVLPYFDASSSLIVDDGDQPTMSVATVGRPPHDADWRSFRIYDSGECSILVGWQTEAFGGLIPAFVPALAQGMDDAIASCGRERSEWITRSSDLVLVPYFHAASAGPASQDRVWMTSTHEAQSLGGCTDYVFQLSMSFGIDVDGDGRFTVAFDDASVVTDGDCIVEGAVESAVRSAVSAGVPPAVAAELQAATQLPPALVGVEPVTCSRDADCVGAYPGTGHVCRSYQCQVSINVDRVNQRPEGIELVIIDGDGDPQADLVRSSPTLSQFCGVPRPGVAFVPGLQQGGLGEHRAPRGRPASEICAAP